MAAIPSMSEIAPSCVGHGLFKEYRSTSWIVRDWEMEWIDVVGRDWKKEVGR